MSVKRAEVFAVLFVLMATACSDHADLPTTSLTVSSAVVTTTSQTEPTSTTLGRQPRLLKRSNLPPTFSMPTGPSISIRHSGISPTKLSMGRTQRSSDWNTSSAWPGATSTDPPSRAGRLRTRPQALSFVVPMSTTRWDPMCSDSASHRQL
jgi:hypothetical protein